MAGISGEIGGFLSSFFIGQEKLEETHKQKQLETKELARQGKAKNVTGQAIDNVMYLRQVKQYYKDLEHMIRYELGMPDLWTEIKIERDKLLKEQKEIADLLKIAAEQAEAKRRFKRQQLNQMLHIYIALGIGGVAVVLSVTGLMWLIDWERDFRWHY